MTKKEVDLVQLENALHNAVFVSMFTIYFECRNRSPNFRAEMAEIKADTTIVTPVDKKSEAIGKIELRDIPGTMLHGEETGESGDKDADIVIYFDPLDGSRPFAVGANTSTVIAAAYDKKKKKVIRCVVGDPIGGRIWEAEGKTKLQVTFITTDGAKEATEERKVWNGDLSAKSVVFLDSYPGFKRNGKTILSIPELAKLHEVLTFGGYKKAECQEPWALTATLMLGSNGMHHALVANGGEFCAGAITTAIGGPWDVCPVLLVLAAGGAAKAFSVDNGNLVEKDPLDVTSYDVLITGNSQKTVDQLVLALKMARI